MSEIDDGGGLIGGVTIVVGGMSICFPLACTFGDFARAF
jgi:hypothetical protein